VEVLWPRRDMTPQKSVDLSLKAEQASETDDLKSDQKIVKFVAVEKREK
jgi:hypothetical protein